MVEKLISILLLKRKIYKKDDNAEKINANSLAEIILEKVNKANNMGCNAYDQLRLKHNLKNFKNKNSNKEINLSITSDTISYILLYCWLNISLS